jgi:Na+/H+ antiporter NhaD/arsenite permease-like protein
MKRVSRDKPGWRVRLGNEGLLLLFGALAIGLALADPRPLTAYRHWLQLPTLAGLAGLLIAIQGIRDSGLVQRAAVALVAKTHSLRSLGLLLVASTALLSMVLTNDVSLFLIVPLTLVISGMTNLPVLRMVILEALAVNAGSTLSPIGNPPACCWPSMRCWRARHCGGSTAGCYSPSRRFSSDLGISPTCRWYDTDWINWTSANL